MVVFSIIPLHRNFHQKDFSNMYYKIPSGLFSMNCSYKVHG